MGTRLLLYLTFLLCLAGIAAAQDQEEKPPIWTVTQLSDHIYKLEADAGAYINKVIASVGEDGLLIVDSGLKEHAEALKAELAKLEPSAPKYIINTHEHTEHIGGNNAWGEAPVVIGHSSLRKVLTSGLSIFDEFDKATLPDLVFSDTMTLYFNGEEIKLMAFSGSHSGSDIVIWFTGSKIACVGALSNGHHFPSIDKSTGDVNKYPEKTEKLIETLPDETMIISGHGQDGTLADYKEFHDMLVGTSGIVCAEAQKGEELAALQEKDILKDYESFDGGYINRNKWVEYLFDGCMGTNLPDHSKKSPYEPIYYAIKERGAEEAIKLYHKLKDESSDEYYFDGRVPLLVGYKLLQYEDYTNSEAFFKVYLEESPEGKYNWYSLYALGLIYKERGEKDGAIEYLKKSLEINPDNQDARKNLAELEK